MPLLVGTRRALLGANAAPTVTVPGAQATAYGTNLVFSSGNSNAISVTDASDGVLTVAMSIGTGTLTLASTTGLTGSGNGTGTLSYSGSVAAWGAALATLTYAPATSGGVKTLTITATDSAGLQTQRSVQITVKAATDIQNDGSSTFYYFHRADEAALSPTGDFWLCGWVMFDATGAEVLIASKYDMNGTAANCSWRLYLNSTVLKFVVIGGTTFTTVTSTKTISTGTFYFFKCKHVDGASAQIAVDDEAWQSAAHTAHINDSTFSFAVGTAMRIGATTPDSAAARLLNGRVDSLVVAGASGATIPSDAQFAQFRNGGNGIRKSEASAELLGLIGNGAWYDFDAGTGVDSLNSLNLTAVGTVAVVAGKA